MQRTRIYLIRHGQVAGFEEKRYNGHADVPLTAEGEAQFGLLQLRLQKKEFSAVYSSDLSRCQIGARLLAAAAFLNMMRGGFGRGQARGGVGPKRPCSGRRSRPPRTNSRSPRRSRLRSMQGRGPRSIRATGRGCGSASSNTAAG